MNITNIVIMLLSIFSILLLSVTFFIPSDSEVYRLITYFDFILCGIFLVDFFVSSMKPKTNGVISIR